MESANPNKKDAKETRIEMNSLLRTIRVLEWDKSRQQINPAKLDKLEKLKKRYEELVSKAEPEKLVKPNETL